MMCCCKVHFDARMSSYESAESGRDGANVWIWNRFNLKICRCGGGLQQSLGYIDWILLTRMQ